MQTPQHQDGPQQAWGDATWQHTACVTPAKQRTRGTGGKEEDSHRFPDFLSSSPLQTLLCAPMGRAQLSQLWPLPTPTTAARTRRHHRAPPAHPHAVGEASIAPQDPPQTTQRDIPVHPTWAQRVTQQYPWVPPHPNQAQGVTRGHPRVPPRRTHFPALQGGDSRGEPSGGPAATPRRAQGGEQQQLGCGAQRGAQTHLHVQGAT